ncbi:MAG: cysteine dioxygenase family protein [Oligoflexia bacterium]|nr:cysteine dioxygenase family protein [Oligoflexia bacterium]
MENLKKKLLALKEDEFKPETILKFLQDANITKDSVKKYVHFEKATYTRNLVCKNAFFEMIILCWEAGHSTMIHDHAAQGCWMTMIDGLIMSDDFKYIAPASFTGSLEKISCASFKKGQSYYIDDTVALHSLRNPVKTHQRAMTLHVYSKPFSSCMAYDLQNKSVNELNLVYHSLQGKRGGPWPAKEINQAL